MMDAHDWIQLVSLITNACITIALAWAVRWKGGPNGKK